MKKLNDSQIKLLNCLSDGLCHSGNELGLTLNVSRTAIWKTITHLVDLGVPIHRILHRGYQLATPIKILDEEQIRRQLQLAHFNKICDFHLFASLDSTNRFLKNLARTPTIRICCAEMQTDGRGRFGRHWYSPFGENIYLSSRWHFDCDLSRFSGLSLVVSLAVHAVLEDLGVHEQIRIKWPNDILWHQKKLCGNLIEVIAESNSSADIIIGIGLNVNSLTAAHPLDDKPWCSLFDITGTYTDRNRLIASLIVKLNHFLQLFISEGFAPFMAKWSAIDYLNGKVITVENLGGTLRGTAQGVNEIGQLILVDDHDITHYLSSGDTTLHQ